jgi:hypothetical protein
MNLFDEVVATQAAEFSSCRNYRYTLHRDWADGQCVGFLMFNPSTADETIDDPTIRKCRGFAERWGYGRMVIVNLFSIRGTDPKIVGRVSDPVGPLNNYHITEATKDCRELVCAWGCGGHMKGALQRRPRAVLELLEEKRFSMPITCLGYSKDGSPRHPLMLAYATPREQFFVAKPPTDTGEQR